MHEVSETQPCLTHQSNPQIVICETSRADQPVPVREVLANGGFRFAMTSILFLGGVFAMMVFAPHLFQ